MSTKPHLRRHVAVPVAVAVVVVVAALVGACSSPKQGFGPGAGAQSGPLQVGVVGNFSGPVSYLGLGTLNGVKYAADVLNDAKPKGIEGREVELVKCDTQFSDTTALNCLSKLTNVDNVDVIVTDTPQGLTTMGKDALSELKIPIFIAGIAGEGTDMPPNVFSVNPAVDDATDPQVLAQFLVRQQGKKRIGIIHSDDQFFTPVSKVYADQLAKAGAAPVDTEQFTISDVDMSSQVRNMQKANVDTVVCLGLGADCARVAESMQRAGLGAELAGSTTFFMTAFRQLAKDASDDAVFTMPHSADNNVDPAFLQWMFNYFRRYGFKTFDIGGSISPDYPGPEINGYTALDLYAKAARAAGSTDPGKVVESLRNPAGYTSIGTHHTWAPGSEFPVVDPPTEPWITRFVNGHVSWDLDKRAYPALEDARIAWEDKVFRAQISSPTDFLLGAVTTMRGEIETRKDALGQQEGQAKYDQQISDLNAAQAFIEQLKATGDKGTLPEFG